MKARFVTVVTETSVGALLIALGLFIASTVLVPLPRPKPDPNSSEPPPPVEMVQVQPPAETKEMPIRIEKEVVQKQISVDDLVKKAARIERKLNEVEKKE